MLSPPLHCILQQRSKAAFFLIERLRTQRVLLASLYCIT